MLEISRNSWHYRMTYTAFATTFVNQKPPVDLCTYVRQFIKAGLLYAVLGLALCGAILDITLFAVYGNEWPVAKDYSFMAFLLWSVVILGWLGLGIFAFIATLYMVAIGGEAFNEYVSEPIQRKIDNKRFERGIVEPKPNIFIEWFKAKKEKICPLVEIVD